MLKHQTIIKMSEKLTLYICHENSLLLYKTTVCAVTTSWPSNVMVIWNHLLTAWTQRNVKYQHHKHITSCFVAFSIGVKKTNYIWHCTLNYKTQLWEWFEIPLNINLLSFTSKTNFMFMSSKINNLKECENGQYQTMHKHLIHYNFTWN